MSDRFAAVSALLCAVLLPAAATASVATGTRSLELPLPKADPTELSGSTQAVGIFESLDPADGNDSVEDLRSLADAGDASAQLDLGHAYLFGEIGPVDRDQARFWLRKASKQGLAAADTELAWIRMTDSSANESAAGWKDLRKLAEKGESSAEVVLGLALLDRQGKTKADQEARHWLERAADHGSLYAQACVLLYRFYSDPSDGAILGQIKALADQDIAPARIFMGLWYLDGKSGGVNTKNAIEMLRGPAEGEYPMAQYALAYALYFDDPATADKGAIFALMKKSAQAGFLPAQAVLADNYLQGFGTKADPALGVYWLQKAAESGNVRSQRALGALLETGYEGHPPEQAAAVVWYRRAAEAGDLSAALELGRLLQQGAPGVERNGAVAAQWLEKAAAEYPGAAGLLADQLFWGIDVARDQTRAAALYRKAADGGVVGAFRMLGLIEGNGLGVSMDSVAGEQWLRRASESGDVTGKAWLASMLLSRNDARANAEGARLAKEAADAGDLDGRLTYADALLSGHGVAVDYKAAMQIFREEAEHGATRAMAGIGLGYLYGQGIQQDYSQASQWLAKAAAGGDAKGQFYYALLLRQQGHYKEAFDLLTQAAAFGAPDALCMLGLMYVYGQGVAPDEQQGYALIQRAADKGWLEAAFYLSMRLSNVGDPSPRAQEVARLSRLGLMRAQAWEAGGYFDRGNYREALARALAPARAGDPDARHMVVAIYLSNYFPLRGPSGKEGFLVGADLANPSEGFVLLTQAAGFGEAWAQNMLAICYENGVLAKKDESEAARLYRLAFDEGSTYAGLSLGLMTLQGRGVALDLDKGFRLIADSVSADRKRPVSELGSVLAHMPSILAMRGIELHINPDAGSAIVKSMPGEIRLIDLLSGTSPASGWTLVLVAGGTEIGWYRQVQAGGIH